MILGKHHIPIERGRENFHQTYPYQNWSNTLAMLPEEILQQTLNINSHSYLGLEEIHNQYTRKHYRYRFPRLRYPRKIETVESDTFILQKNNNVVIIVQNNSWELCQIGGMYTPRISKVKTGLPCNITQCN